jgi:hypothetical protein
MCSCSTFAKSGQHGFNVWYVHMHIYICTCKYAHIHMHIHMYIHQNTHNARSDSVHATLLMPRSHVLKPRRSTSTCVCVHVCIHVHLYTILYVYAFDTNKHVSELTCIHICVCQVITCFSKCNKQDYLTLTWTQSSTFRQKHAFLFLSLYDKMQCLRIISACRQASTCHLKSQNKCDSLRRGSSS